MIHFLKTHSDQTLGTLTLCTSVVKAEYDPKIWDCFFYTADAHSSAFPWTHDISDPIFISGIGLRLMFKHKVTLDYECNIIPDFHRTVPVQKPTVPGQTKKLGPSLQ